MNLKVGILAAIGSFAGSALGAHIVLLLSDELLRTMMFLILPVAAVVILWQRDLPDQNRDDGTLNLKKILLALGIGRHRPVRRHRGPGHRHLCYHCFYHPDGL